LSGPLLGKQNITTMKSMNRVQLVGWLGKDIIVKTAANGTAYGRFRMATDHWHKNPAGETIKKTSWHTVWIWDSKKVAVFKDHLVKVVMCWLKAFLITGSTRMPKVHTIRLLK